MEIKKILITLSLDEEEKAKFISAAHGAEVVFSKSAADEELESFDAIIGNFPEDKIKYAKNIKWLQTASSGVGNQLKIMPKGAVLTSATGAYGLAVAEHGFAMLLTLIKKLHLYRDNQLKSQWQGEGKVGTLRGKNVLLLGFGDIGTNFAKMLSGFDCNVIGVRRDGSKKSPYAKSMHSLEEIDSLLPEADVIFMSLPETDALKQVLGAGQFALMKRRPVIINVGRGIAVDADALCDAIEKGLVAYAGLDVTVPEPLPADSRLWGMKDILITPHSAGGENLYETVEFVKNICLENLRLAAEGKMPKNTISADLGYAADSK